MSTVLTDSADDASQATGGKSDIRLVSRISAVLRILSEQSGGMSLGQIAKAAAIPRGTVQRLVQALEAEGLVARGASDGSIRLGLEIARLGMTMSQEVRTFFRPILEELREASGETVDLTILHPRGAAVVDQVASPRALRVVSRPGQILPLHATASGKAHLSQMNDSARRTVLAGPLTRFTGQTLTDAAEVLTQIAATPPDGVFTDNEEYADGVCAVSIDLGVSALGNVAVAISMPAARFEEGGESCADLLRKLRARLAR